MSTVDLEARAAGIRLAVFDVDGVLTDGRLILDDRGVQTKAFHVRDGLGLKALMRHGIAVAVITARESAVVERRMAELGVEHLRQGQSDKRRAMKELLAELDVPGSQTSYMGDDLIDWPAMRQCALSAAPADADAWIRAQVDIVTEAPGGVGAVREFCERLLAARGLLEDWRAGYQ
ncbi:MAG: phenylphosphate carboxylase subunit delta [Wenzhouxiangella sp.]|jgi:3-deoxy-D-manno-octulosonate 8-phosphate phosphatase (KDO 8-P phosphatase)|nr:phenylphosphate carboxylase subunit delta [Wenzhouxiangella sp.]